MRSRAKFRIYCLFFVLACTALSSCTRRLGWGVLLWSTDDPSILSGTVLPVYIRSNINKLWVVGIPEGLGSSKDGIDKMEIPLSRLDFMGSRAKAQKRANDFSHYALVYAENMQDGLPIRDNPDNSSRRVYRLRYGEIVKVMSLAEGNPAISASGDPLPGDWYRVLTEDGTTGYCFSYRLKLFEHTAGMLSASAPDISESGAEPDPDLDILLSKKWSPESYFTMTESKRINLDDLSRNWHFDPGQETGIARIFVSGIDQNFSYTAIRPDGPRTWRFDGTNLRMQLRSDSLLAVHFTESSGGSMKTLLFVALPIMVNDLVIQESARRERLYNAIYRQGPVFTSNNYGSIVFRENKTFSWKGFDLLTPQFIPDGIDGSGTVAMDLFPGSELEDRYTGAFTLHFSGSAHVMLRCIYALDNQGFRIEIAPESTIEENTIVRRASSPMVLYFFNDTGLW